MLSMMRDAQFKREIFSFIVVGLIATLADFILYASLQCFFFYSVAKTLSFCSGSVVAYFLNKFITFKKKKHALKEAFSFSLLYGFALLVNVSINSESIVLLSSLSYLSKPVVLTLAFLMATAVSTVISFLGQRLWVFKKLERS
jgi:putative flippase GtrA